MSQKTNKTMDSDALNLADKVKEKSVQQLYEHFSAVLVSDLIAIAVFTVIMWNGVNHALLMAWMITAVIANCVARLINYAYRKLKKKKPDMHFWLRLFIASVFMGGCIWGLAGLFFLDTDDLHRILILLMLTAIAGASNSVLVPSKAGFLAFVLPIYFSMIMVLIYQNSFSYYLMMLGLAALCALICLLIFSFSDELQKTLWLQFKNEELLDYLTDAKLKLEERKAQLEVEIDKRKQIEEKLHELATHDYLTGLPNRRLLEKNIKTQIFSMDVQDELALLFVDLDHFKEVNDTLGHHIGDQLLIKIANRIKNAVRKQDFIARLGGDEFCVIMHHVSEKYSIERVAATLCEVIHAPCLIEGHDITISASIGISVYPVDSRDMHTLFRNADKALYKVKQTGRNNFSFYNDKLT